MHHLTHFLRHGGPKCVKQCISRGPLTDHRQRRPALPLAPPRVTPAFLNRPKQPFLTAVSNCHNSCSVCKNSNILSRVKRALSQGTTTIGLRSARFPSLRRYGLIEHVDEGNGCRLEVMWLV